MASGHTAQRRALIEQTLGARHHGIWVCTGHAKGIRKRLVHSTVRRDTNDTKSIASDIGAIRNGRMVAYLS